MGNILNIAVKVGKQSDLKFISKKTKVIRAVNGKEFKSIIDRNSIDILIVENIQENEYDYIKEIIKSYSSNTKGNVFFYVKDNDDITCGLADELEYDIYLQQRDLNRVIYEIYNLDISVDMSKKTIPNIYNEEGSDKIFDSNFDTSFGTIDSTVESIPYEDTNRKENAEPITKVAEELAGKAIDSLKEAVVKTSEIIKDGLDNTLDTTEVVAHTVKDIVDSTIDTVKDIVDIDCSDKGTENSQENNNIETDGLEADIVMEESKVDTQELARVSELEEAIEAIVQERDTYKEMLESIKSDNSIIEDPIEYSKYKEIQDKLAKYELEVKQLNNKIHELIQIGATKVDTAELDGIQELLSNTEQEKSLIESRLEAIVEERDSLESKIESIEEEKRQTLSIIDTLENDKRQLEEQIKSIVQDKKSIEVSLESFNIDKTELEEQNKALSLENESLQDKIKTLTNDMEVLSSEIDNKNNVIENLKSTLNELNNISSELESYKLRIELLGKNIDISNGLLEKAVREIVSLNGANQQLRNKNESLEEVNRTYESTTESLREQIKELESKCSVYGNENNILESRIEELTLKASAVDTIENQCKERYTEQINKLTLEKVEAQSKLSLVAEQLRMKEQQYNILMQTTGVDSNTAMSIMENNKTLESINQTLRSQLAMLQGDLEKANNDKMFALNTAKSLEETNKQLKTSLSSMTYGMRAGTGVQLPPCNYSGKGLIIPVFGCGSFGITTTAMSIANKLAQNSSVLYIDFDLVMPKADGWFNTSPVVKGLPDQSLGNSSHTALSILMDKQIGYFIQYSNYIVHNISSSTRGRGKLDYIGGLYAKQDSVKLVSADYTTFFNYCGNNYDYVIVDMGKLGCSDIGDQLIKIVSDIAYRNVVVTTNDKFEVRTFSVRLTQNKIDKNNVAWLLNMCESTKNLDESFKKWISPAEYTIMPFSQDIFGKRASFNTNKMTRDRCDSFIQNIFKR